jgi:hypothetical protein
VLPAATREIAARAWPLGQARVFILTWEVIEDARHLRVESCLVLKAIGDGSYRLTSLYRWPLEANPEWRIATIHVGPREGVQELGKTLYQTFLFRHRPTNQELYAALAEDVAEDKVVWRFELERGWKRLGGAVCEAAWFAALGEKPTRFYLH